MKRVLLLSCFALCACAPYATQPAPQPVVYAEPAPVASAPAYAMKPPAYEQKPSAIDAKEQEVFAKEKALIAAQDELYKREQMLADREANFFNKSKALSYKELMMQEQQPASQSAPPSMPAPRREVMYRQTVQLDEPAGYATNAPIPVRGVQTYDTPMPTPSYASTPQDDTVTQSGYIIMQHPIQRDLVRCPVTDDVCLASYERLGYVRSQNLSRFTAQDEDVSQSTYPAGQWRENNTIPRW